MSSSPAANEACCAVLYGEPLIDLLAGESLHPGGYAASRRLLALARLSMGDRILDAGCGLGATARIAALEFGLVVDACDVSSEVIRRATKLAQDADARIRFTEASLLRLPYPDGSFAGVLAECVLSTTSKTQALAEIRRVIAPGGRLLVSDVVSSGDIAAPEPLGSLLCLTRAWRPGELEEEAASAGFIIEQTWDESAGLSDLIVRVEARGALVSTILRDAGGPEALSSSLRALLGGADVGSLRSLLDEAQRAVRDERIRYTAWVARAV
ncbi:MAG: class I SAM-dependent methyltransferase [Chloroflexota bacterium]